MFLFFICMMFIVFYSMKYSCFLFVSMYLLLVVLCLDLFSFLCGVVNVFGESNVLGFFWGIFFVKEMYFVVKGCFVMWMLG